MRREAASEYKVSHTQRSVSTSLFKMVQTGLLKTPVQKGFSEDAWNRALKELPQPSLEDLRIHGAAVFFGAQLNALRRILAGKPPAGGKLETQLRRAIGSANREYLVVLQDIASRQTPGPIWLPDVAQMELQLCDGINAAKPDDLVETLVDALRFELAALMASGEVSSSLSASDAIDRIALRGNLSIFYHALEEQWLECLHHGWAVSQHADGSFEIHPSNWEAAVDWEIGQYREKMLQFELLGIATDFMRRLPDRQLVRGILPSGAGKHRAYSVGTATGQVSNQAMIYKMMASDTDIEPFMFTPLPNLDGLTAMNVLQVWTALLTLVEARLSAASDRTEIKNPDQLVQLATIEDTAGVIVALERCTKLSRKECAAAMKQLTWRSVRDSLWLRPVVSLREGSHFSVVWPALATPNLRRSVEYWLGEGGGDLGERGGDFEEFLRREFAQAISRNALLSECAGVAPGKFQPTDSRVGDIDLLLWIGGPVLVGEIKCLLRPGTAHERHQFEARLAEASEQAARKAAYIQQNLGCLSSVSPEAARLVGASGRVIPCVLINSALGALRKIGDVPIVDRYVLGLYLSEGGTRMQAYTDDPDSGIRLDFYSNAAEAATGLAQFLVSPDHLEAYRKSAERSVS